jgi:hypothetical protein
MTGAKCAILATAFVAAASSGVQAQSDLQAELAHCLSLGGAVERLSCYDRLAHEAGDAAPPNPSAPRTISPSRVDAAANGGGPQDFGKEQLRSTIPASEDRMTAEIADFHKDGHDRFTVALQNGQVWQQMAGDTGVAQFRSGSTHQVIISRGAMGSYDLRFNDRNATYKVLRLR